MNIHIKTYGTVEIAEIISSDVIINTPQDALDLMASTPCKYIVLYEHNLDKNFFDLKTGLAGEILQKFTNYQVNLAVIGDFTKYSSKSLQAYIYESNRHKDFIFLPSLDSVIKCWQT